MTRTDRLTEAHDRLVAAVEALTSGEDWQRFLAVARRFHAYSANNVLLILAQRPDATRVAGYRAWRELGRHVRRGERGIAILAPCTYRAQDDDTDDEARTVLHGFRVVHVFDVTQTEGDDLPEPPIAVLGGDDPRLLRHRLAALVRAEGYSFSLGPLPRRFGDALGLTDHGARAVTVRDDLPPAQQAKTAAHELAHVLLHRPGHATDRGRIEVEAESVAHIVCGAAGLHTDAYSFGYVASWSGGDTTVIRDTAARVLDCARRVLGALGIEAADDRAA